MLMAHQKGVLRTDREVGTVPIGKARGAVRSCGQKRVSFFERFLSVCPEPVLVNVRFLVEQNGIAKTTFFSHRMGLVHLRCG